tara:strand:- start:76 stop:300 length:225 start_codon:yes stop_codon:yes gene_type:complete
MSLSRKHFEAFAEDIKNLMQADMRFQEQRDEAFSDFIDGLCYYFRQENSNFDRDKFIKACGFENGLYPDEEYND